MLMAALKVLHMVLDHRVLRRSRCRSSDERKRTHGGGRIKIDRFESDSDPGLEVFDRWLSSRVGPPSSPPRSPFTAHSSSESFSVRGRI